MVVSCDLLAQASTSDVDCGDLSPLSPFVAQPLFYVLPPRKAKAALPQNKAATSRSTPRQVGLGLGLRPDAITLPNRNSLV